MKINIDVVICENTVSVGVRFDATALEILAANEARINVVVRERNRAQFLEIEVEHVSISQVSIFSWISLS